LKKKKRAGKAGFSNPWQGILEVEEISKIPE
jgi:hypothetical protein